MPTLGSSPEPNTFPPFLPNPAPAAAIGGALIAGLIGVPLIKRQVARDWEELEKAEVIPELRQAGEVRRCHAGCASCMHLGSDGGKLHSMLLLEKWPAPGAVQGMHLRAHGPLPSAAVPACAAAGNTAALRVSSTAPPSLFIHVPPRTWGPVWIAGWLLCHCPGS